MKYCIPYSRTLKFDYYDEVDEYKITFRKEDTTLPAFLEAHADKTIVIDVPSDQDEDGFNLIKLLGQKYTNIIVSISAFLRGYAEELKQESIKFMFSDYVRGWDQLQDYLDAGVCSVCVVEEICFSIKAIADVVHSYGATVRVFPNIAQSQSRSIPDVKKFFIRPEDTEKYEPYVDIYELFHQDNLNTYYEIYAKDKEWFGDLSEIIMSFYGHLDSRCVIDYFGEMRLDCDKRCLKGGACAICDRCVELAAAMEDKDLIFTK